MKPAQVRSKIAGRTVSKPAEARKLNDFLLEEFPVGAKGREAWLNALARLSETSPEWKAAVGGLYARKKRKLSDEDEVAVATAMQFVALRFLDAQQK